MKKGILTPENGRLLQKRPPKYLNLTYKWSDSKWMKSRKKNNALDAPISVYEMHLGSWSRKEGWK